jgi:hypothetical protein
MVIDARAKVTSSGANPISGSPRGGRESPEGFAGPSLGLQAAVRDVATLGGERQGRRVAEAADPPAHFAPSPFKIQDRLRRRGSIRLG